MSERKRKRIPEKIRQRIYDMYGGRCAYCGQKIPTRRDMRIDHVVSFNRGGADDESNYLPACHDCNFYKSSFTLKDFKESLGAMVGNLAKREITFRLAIRYGLISVNPDVDIRFLFQQEPPNGNFGLNSSSIDAVTNNDSCCANASKEKTVGDNMEKSSFLKMLLEMNKKKNLDESE